MKKPIALILGGIAFLFSDVLFFGSGFYLRDTFRDYMPSRFVFREILLRYHELPLWNPWFSAGQPLAANPGFQVFYPGTWLVLLPDFRWGFGFELVAHIALAAAGMYVLLRALELRNESALFGSVAFALGGAILSLTYSLPFLIGVAWWPLIVLFELRVLRGGTRREAALFALVLAMMFLAAEQSVIVETAILIAAVFLAERAWKRLPLLIAGGIVAMLIAAVQLGPALQLKGESGRATAMPLVNAMAWSMPADRPIELFWPHAHGVITDNMLEYRGMERYRPPKPPLMLSIYCGLAVPLLFVAGLFLRVRWRWWALALAAISYLMAIGDNGPLMPILYDLGLFRTMRYPEKYVILGLFAMIVFAAIVIDRFDRRVVLVVLLLTIADVGRYLNEIVPRMPGRFFDPPPAVDVVAESRGRSRIFNAIEWHPEVGRFLGRNTYPNVRAMLMPYSETLWGIAGVCEMDKNLTTQQPTRDFVESMFEATSRGAPYGPFLGMANAEFVIAPGDPSRNPMSIVHIATRPRYEFADQVVRIGSRQEFVDLMTKSRWSDRVAFVETRPFVPAVGVVTRVAETPTAIDVDVRAAGRALLLIRNTPHPNWRATIDDRAARLQVANVGFTALEVPAGSHHIALRYRDSLMALCAVVSALALIAAIIGALQRPR